MIKGQSATSGVRRTAVVLAGLIAGMFMLPAAVAAQPVLPQLGATDLALLDGVRLAGLWEMPAGQMAAQKGSQQRVREVGAQIAQEHARLDELVVEAANELGVPLPAEPNDTQKGWLAEMTAANGRQFDQIFVDRLRAAHGKIFPVIAAVRASTRNESVRQLADDANGFVLNHMTLLESTGLVRYGELPPAVLPADDLAPDGSFAASALARSQVGGGFDPVVVWVVLLAALVAGGAATYRVFRPR